MKINSGALLLSTILFAICSCKTITHFDTPNNMGNVKSNLYLKDGHSINGYLTINTENKKKNKISILTDGSKKQQKFKLIDIKGFSIGPELFLLKEVNNDEIIIEKGRSLIDQLLTKKKYYFMKRLTNESSRIHLFENSYLITEKENGNTYSRKVIEYYLQLPDDSTTVYAIDDNKFVPHFEDKMSALVRDCSTLANKIAQKQPGYFYAQVSPLKEKNAVILLNIIKEYNECK